MAGPLIGLATGAQIGGGIFGTIHNVQQTAWERAQYLDQKRREDTAVQRRAADMRAAGINPILAAGQEAAAGAPISPNHIEAPDFSAISEAIKLGLEHKQMELNEKMGDATIDEQIEKTRALKLQNDYFEQTFGLNKRRVEAQEASARAQQLAAEAAALNAGSSSRQAAVMERARDMADELSHHELLRLAREWDAIKDVPVFQEHQTKTNAIMKAFNIDPESPLGKAVLILSIAGEGAMNILGQLPIPGKKPPRGATSGWAP